MLFRGLFSHSRLQRCLLSRGCVCQDLFKVYISPFKNIPSQISAFPHPHWAISSLIQRFTRSSLWYKIQRLKMISHYFSELFPELRCPFSNSRFSGLCGLPVPVCLINANQNPHLLLSIARFWWWWLDFVSIRLSGQIFWTRVILTSCPQPSAQNKIIGFITCTATWKLVYCLSLPSVTAHHRVFISCLLTAHLITPAMLLKLCSPTAHMRIIVTMVEDLPCDIKLHVPG